MSKTYMKIYHQPLCFPRGKKIKGAFSYLLLAAGVVVTKVCVRQICLGKFSFQAMPK